MKTVVTHMTGTYLVETLSDGSLGSVKFFRRGQRLPVIESEFEPEPEPKPKPKPEPKFVTVRIPEVRSAPVPQSSDIPPDPKFTSRKWLKQQP